MRMPAVIVSTILFIMLAFSCAEAQTNLALHKPAQMSSQYSAAFPASNGVDGKQDTMFHTNTEKTPWWQVDLQQISNLNTIVLHNRDTFRERARSVQVLLSQDGNNWQIIYSHNGTDFLELKVDAGGRSARYVRVQLAQQDYLHLGEVEVYGSSGTADNGKLNTLRVTISASKQTVGVEESFRTTAEAVGGTPPYRYRWFNNNSQSQITANTVNWTPHAAGARVIKVEVTDATGNIVTAQSNLTVQANAAAADSTPRDTRAGDQAVLPAWTLAPKVSVDFAELSKAHPAGMAATLAAGTEMLGGQPAEKNKVMAPLYDYVPTAAAAPAAAQVKALGNAAALRGSQEAALAGMKQAWQEAVLATEYGDETAAREALDIVHSHYETAAAAQKGLNSLVTSTTAAQPLPDPAAEKAKANEAYRRLIAHTKASAADNASSPTAAPQAGKAGFKLISINMPTEDRAPAEGESYIGQGTEAGFQAAWYDYGDKKTVSYQIRWSFPGVLLPGVPAKFRISESGSAPQHASINYQNSLLLAGVREGSKDYPAVASDEFDLVLPDALIQAIKDLRERHLRARLKFRMRNQAQLEDIIVATNGGSGQSAKTPSQVALEDRDFPFPDTWDPSGKPSMPQCDLKVAVVLYGKSLALYTYRLTDDVGSIDAAPAVAANEPPLPDLPADKVEDGRLHQANIGAIQTRLAKDQAELAREKDPKRRAELEWIILGEKSDLVAEQDLLASLEKGTIVHSRSPFDDYAHDRFVDSIRESQQDMAAFQRERAAIPRLLALLPADQQPAMRAFVERQLTSDVLAKMDHAKLRGIANALSNQVQGYWQGESARHLEKAAEYSDYLTRAERVKMIADTAVMIGSMGSGSLYRLAGTYAAAAGMATGGPVEAVKDSSLYFSAPLHAAMEAMAAYPKDGLWGATKSGAIGFMMSKMVQLGNPDGQTEKLTVQETMKLAEFKQAQARGQAMARDFAQARSELVAARNAGRPIPEVRALERQVADRAAAVQTDLHAKSFLKYQADRELRTAFASQIDELHANVETRFHEIMTQAGWNPQELRAIRNASSAGSVNMDFDIMLVERPGMTFTRNGEISSISEWNTEAQRAWEQAFHDLTGRNAGHAMEELTYSGHPEAYKDLAVIGRDPTQTSRIWASQVGDVTRYKADTILTSSKLGAVDYYTRLMEAARGTAKDIDTKLLNRLRLFKNRIPGAEGGQRQQELLDRWTEIQGLLKDIGEGRIDPVHGDHMVRNLSGGYDIPDVINHASSMISEFGKLSAKIPMR